MDSISSNFWLIVPSKALVVGSSTGSFVYDGKKLGDSSYLD